VTASTGIPRRAKHAAEVEPRAEGDEEQRDEQATRDAED
jgi:hypothetical protein